MKALTPPPIQSEHILDEPKVSPALAAEISSAAIFEAIRVRESILLPVPEQVLHLRPSSHWGINE